MMITADRATPDTMGEILSDIESQGVHATQIKALHREIMTQRGVSIERRSPRPRHSPKTPATVCTGTPPRRRLSAEQIRDAVLLVSGALDARLGGPSVPLTPLGEPPDHLRPRQPLQAGRVPAALRLSQPSQSAEQRFATSVPLQRLFFMNSDFIQQHAERVAEKVADEPDDAARIEKGLSAVVRTPADGG